jgi:hypothetical protein
MGPEEIWCNYQLCPGSPIGRLGQWTASSTSVPFLLVTL